MSPSMQTTAALPRSHKPALRDLIALTKPRITLLVLITAAGGAWLSDVQHDPLRTVLLLSMISILVGGANALNCYLERDSDRLMERTASRPLPAGRLAPHWGLIVGLVLGLGVVAVLALGINMLDRKSTRLNSSHVRISYAVFCLKKKKITNKHDI